MALVDYSSSSSSHSDSENDEAPSAPPAKRRKRSPGSGTQPDVPSAPSSSESGLPPLPAAFHDLYASTVRHSVVDDPALHQGRKRLIPHVVGNWPSHLYIEWHPLADQHEKLVQLVCRVNEQIGSRVKLHSFLKSDLGAPLPLHISLSRPISLTTSNKDVFLDKISSALQASAVPQFSSFNQPILYQTKGTDSADEAFHISIGWALDLPVDEESNKALSAFGDEEFQSLKSWEVSVPGVKVKIGNVLIRMSSGLGTTSTLLR
ncbi:hypothetical protein TrVGV298_002977 [Trichoderma virens]|nr:hypothetical protein TrVGV298_002977 [Trichoderma virens]